ncbi:hypothetical protein L596_013337 [Steinernema carpocapsae]|uniref:Uncharacterized protein n=1 Tax=Steinernema carpocapsae TaxID=34508 RepID=A0A4U5NZU3_STECR|nr:hypothetical protein L596_013337 [Steinernema carpocapsae]
MEVDERSVTERLQDRPLTTLRHVEVTNRPKGTFQTAQAVDTSHGRNRPLTLKRALKVTRQHRSTRYSKAYCSR